MVGGSFSSITYNQDAHLKQFCKFWAGGHPGRKPCNYTFYLSRYCGVLPIEKPDTYR